MRRGVSDQSTAGFEWRVQPLMWIERHGIGALDSGDAKGILRGDSDERAYAAIDVEPQVLFFRQAGESLQIIDCAGVYSSGRSDDAGRLPTPAQAFAARLHQRSSVS